MPEQPVLKENPPAHDNLVASPASAPAEPQAEAANKKVYSVINACALGMIICFFLPWISFLFSEVSGYQLQRLGGREITQG